ncbi:MAG: CHASE2 domain-containing protein, partial [Cyanobacteria bacterium P01_H01_bin.58]
SEAIPPPATVPPERVGFNDFPVDPDGVIRRNLLFADANTTPNSETLYSFSLRLALAYLEAEAILPVQSDVNPRYLALDGTDFYPIGPHFGGYRSIDNAGYQIMLQYRSQTDSVERLSLSDLLSGQFTNSMIRDRIVIIGTTAPSAKDLFYTPFSEAAAIDHLMPGVVLHVQATSQLLSHVLNEQPLPWQFPEALEIAWILLASGTGGALGWYARRLWILGLSIIGGGLIWVGIPALAFTAGGWLPVLSANAAFVSSLVVIALYRTRQNPKTAIGQSLTFATAPPPTALPGMSEKQT